MVCSICGKITATGQDHIDCTEKRRIESEGASSKERLEELELSKSPLGTEIKTILEHLAKDQRS